MTEISRFSGMVVHMYWDEHPWPHIHVRYAEYTASFDLRAMHFTRGDLPRPQERELLRWARLHQDELLANWNRMERAEAPHHI